MLAEALLLLKPSAYKPKQAYRQGIAVTDTGSAAEGLVQLGVSDIEGRHLYAGAQIPANSTVMIEYAELAVLTRRERKKVSLVTDAWLFTLHMQTQSVSMTLW